MTILFVLALLAWGAVLVYMVPAVGSIIAGRPRDRDPARLRDFGYALLSISSAARWLFAPANQTVLVAIFIGSIVIALYTLHTARSYGRGPRV